MTETINHPKHYNTHPSMVECIDLIEWLGTNRGSAVKYLWRKDDKGKPKQDADKALWFTSREVQRLKKYRLHWSFCDEIPTEIEAAFEKWKAFEPDGWRKDVVCLIWEGHSTHLQKAVDILATEVHRMSPDA